MATKQPMKGNKLSGALASMPRTSGPSSFVAPRDGQIYAGGSPNFDERTGQFRQPPHSGNPVYIPENPQMPPHSGGPIGIPENRGPVKGPGFQAPLQRVSPGIYRNASGDLVNSSGGRLPGNVYRQPGYAQHDPRRNQQQVIQGALQGVGAGADGSLGGNLQPMPRPVLNDYSPAYGNFAGAGRPMPRPVLGQLQPLPLNYGTAEQADMNPAYRNYANQPAAGQVNAQVQPFNPNTPPPQPGMQLQYGMTGQPIGWGWGQSIS
jgi:hypothetical protein